MSLAALQAHAVASVAAAGTATIASIMVIIRVMIFFNVDLTFFVNKVLLCAVYYAMNQRFAETIRKQMALACKRYTMPRP